MGEAKYIVFQLGNEKYSMNLSYVSGIEDSYSIVPVPNGPANIKGIMNLRGDVVPVFSLRQKFMMPEADKSQSGKLLLAFTRGMVVAFEVDSIVGIETVEEKNINKVPKVVMNQETKYMDCVLKLGKEIVIGISVDYIFSEEEISRLNDLIEENA